MTQMNETHTQNIFFSTWQLPLNSTVKSTTYWKVIIYNKQLHLRPFWRRRSVSPPLCPLHKIKMWSNSFILSHGALLLGGSSSYNIRVIPRLRDPTKSVVRTHKNTAILHVLRCSSSTRNTEIKGRNTILECIGVRWGFVVGCLRQKSRYLHCLVCTVENLPEMLKSVKLQWGTPLNLSHLKVLRWRAIRVPVMFFLHV